MQHEFSFSLFDPGPRRTRRRRRPFDEQPLPPDDNDWWQQTSREDVCQQNAALGDCISEGYAKEKFAALRTMRHAKQ